MNFIKANLKRILPTALLIIGIGLALVWFLTNNTNRISQQNEEYIQELTVQRAISIDNLTEENLSFIRSTAYLYGQGLSTPEADVNVIREYEENTVFDMLRFVNTSGDNYTSQGVRANLADRAYFQAGMRGESGTTYVLQSRVTGEKQIGFYAPVYFEGNIIGVMVGFYGEAYINRLLEYELFGSQGEGWLVTRDGTVLGSTDADEHENFFTCMAEEGKMAEAELSRLETAFAKGESTSFTWQEEGEEATGYAVALSSTDWMLIRSFPPAAADQMLNNANGAGERLIMLLVALFTLYTAYIALITFLDKRRMTAAAQNAHDVSTGVSRVFDKFITVDFTTREYRYIVGQPGEASLPPTGRYADFYDFVIRHIPEEQLRQEARGFLSTSALQERLRESDRTSIRLHVPMQADEWFTYNFVVLERDGETIIRLLIICQEVSELHQKEEKDREILENALDTAEKASRAKSEFLFNMSHDLRTPMNAIIGYTELAQGQQVTKEEMGEYIHKIDASSQHLLALINDILEMSRIESGKLTIEEAPGNLHDVLSEIRELFQTQMDSKHIVFTVDDAALTPAGEEGGRDYAWALFDKHRLSRILMNLISNAYKFTPEGGEVRVSLGVTEAREDGALYEFRVKDNGIGMSKEFAEKLFTPFERERTSTVSGIQGTGLGLSITKSLVDLMGGSIDVTTAQNVGTEFVLHLPFKKAEPLEEEKALPAEEEGSAIDFHNVRLLLVEDNMINREIATMILSQSGFMLETAENGQIAVDMVAASKPGYYQAVLMDIQMPVMDGYTAARTIRQLEDPALSSIPIIAMTANAFKEDVETAKAAGMNAHLSKPLDVEKMLTTIQEVLT